MIRKLGLKVLHHLLNVASCLGHLSALTQPEVKIILQVSGALFDGVEDEVGVTGVKSAVQVLRDRHQVEVLHSPHLEARLLSSTLELWVLRCHPAGRKMYALEVV